jgi:membrane protease YdiL (CAAX protease family)
LASGLWVLAFELLRVLTDLGFGAISLDRSEALEDAKAEFAKIPFWMILVTSAIIPALAEEFFFRGYVMSALRSRLKPLRWAPSSFLASPTCWRKVSLKRRQGP